MQILYAIINVLLLAGVILLFGRKMIVSIFKNRREKINKDLDEAEEAESFSGVVPENHPVSLETAEDACRDEVSAINASANEKAAEIQSQTEELCSAMRREMISQVKDDFMGKLKVRIVEIFSSEPHSSYLREHEGLFAEKILDRIKLTPGDMAYLKSHDVLYVTVTSAHELPEDIVEKIRLRTEKLLAEVGGKSSFWVRVDPSLIGGLKLRIGDTVYDCTVIDELYHFDKALQKRIVSGTENADDILEDIFRCMENVELKVNEFQLGRVISISDGICWLDGLSDIMYGEVVEFDCGERGMVLDIQHDRIGCIVYGRYEHIESGSRVRRVGRIASVPVGKELLGRVVNPLGRPLDGKGRIWTAERRPIECHAPTIPERMSVNTPMHTGIKAIDALVPIGRGQRELIIGDRQTGKTALAVDAILNQKGKDVVCIYVAIGQKETTVANIRAKLEQYGAMEYTTIVCATASSSASFQYIAPFSGTAMGEYFMYAGKNVLIIYDDLSKHAVAYRELSLLLHRPSGREAYPGDIFYLHARLLERSAQLSTELGGGSMTALPIVETQAGDISAYIPTNVISITDGQIFLESELFNAGQRPAINVGLSVSRVGSDAQTKLMKQVSSRLRMNLAQYRELASFAQFGMDIDENTKKVLDSGERMMAALRQARFAPLEDWKQALLIYAVSENFAALVLLDQMDDFAEKLYAYFEKEHTDLKNELSSGAKMSAETEALVKQALSSFAEVYGNGRA